MGHRRVWACTGLREERVEVGRARLTLWTSEPQMSPEGLAHGHAPCPLSTSWIAM
jgi:acyl-coenzyme A thioesterase PaaI-like protein